MWVPRETFVCKNWKYDGMLKRITVSFFLKTVWRNNRLISTKTAVTKRFIVWSNFRHKGTLSLRVWIERLCILGFTRSIGTCLKIPGNCLAVILFDTAWPLSWSSQQSLGAGRKHLQHLKVYRVLLCQEKSVIKHYRGAGTRSTMYCMMDCSGGIQLSTFTKELNKEEKEIWGTCTLFFKLLATLYLYSTTFTRHIPTVSYSYQLTFQNLFFFSNSCSPVKTKCCIFNMFLLLKLNKQFKTPIGLAKIHHHKA